MATICTLLKQKIQSSFLTDAESIWLLGYECCVTTDPFLANNNVVFTLHERR